MITLRFNNTDVERKDAKAARNYLRYHGLNIKLAISRDGDVWTFDVNAPEGQKKMRSWSEVLADFLRVHGDAYDYSEVIYIDTQTKIIIICRACGHKFEQRPNDHRAGRGCPRCGIKKKSTSQRKDWSEVLAEFREIHGDAYDYSLAVYVNNKTKITIICRSCGNKFEQTPSNHHAGNGCPNCASSKGEQYLAKYFADKGIYAIRQMRFPDCKSIKALPFDFYLPKHNILIEYNGRQHYQNIPGFFDSFSYRRYKDKIKAKYARDNGIELHIIRYDEDLDQRISEIFMS